jgi:hypothetical protein
MAADNWKLIQDKKIDLEASVRVSSFDDPSSALLMTKDAERPPCPGCTVDSGSIVYNNLYVVADAQRIHGSCEPFL